jgi:O-antigen ligase
MVVRQRQIRITNSRAIYSLIVFILVSILSFGMGQFEWYPLARNASLPSQLGGLAVFILSAGAFLLGAHQIPDMRWLKRLIWLFMIIGSFVVIGRLLSYLGNSINIFPRGAATSLFWVWFAALAFSQALCNSQLPTHWRAVLMGLVFGSIYVNLFLGTSWVSGWLPALVAVITIIWVGIPQLRLHFTLLGGLGIVVFASTIWDFLLSDNQYSYMTRLEAWRIVGEIVKVNPIFGLGPSNYRFYTPLFSIFGYNVPFNSHNNYVDIIAQIGFLGLACFIWFSWEVGRLGWKLYPKVQDGFAKAFVLGCLGGLGGTLVAGMLGDWVLPFVYNVGLQGFRSSVLGWLFLGGLVALERGYSRSVLKVDG